MSGLCVEYQDYSSNVSAEDSVECMQSCLASRQLYGFLDLAPADCSHLATVTVNTCIYHNDIQYI
jgi:hypothetical protein